jgi:hypothetical protein
VARIALLVASWFFLVALAMAEDAPRPAAPWEVVCDQLAARKHVEPVDVRDVLVKALKEHPELAASEEATRAALEIVEPPSEARVMNCRGRWVVVEDHGLPAYAGWFRITVVDAENPTELYSVELSGGNAPEGVCVAPPKAGAWVESDVGVAARLSLERDQFVAGYPIEFQSEVAVRKAPTLRHPLSALPAFSLADAKRQCVWQPVMFPPELFWAGVDLTEKTVLGAYITLERLDHRYVFVQREEKVFAGEHLGSLVVRRLPPGEYRIQARLSLQPRDPKDQDAWRELPQALDLKSLDVVLKAAEGQPARANPTITTEKSALFAARRAIRAACPRHPVNSIERKSEETLDTKLPDGRPCFRFEWKHGTPEISGSGATAWVVKGSGDCYVTAWHVED